LEQAADASEGDEADLYLAEADNLKKQLGALALGQRETTTAPVVTTAVENDLNTIADQFVSENVATKGEDGLLIANENQPEDIKRAINELNRKLKGSSVAPETQQEIGELFGTVRRRTWQ
jgi:hypothetical protein